MFFIFYKMFSQNYFLRKLKIEDFLFSNNNRINLLVPPLRLDDLFLLPAIIRRCVRPAIPIPHHFQHPASSSSSTLPTSLLRVGFPLLIQAAAPAHFASAASRLAPVGGRLRARRRRRGRQGDGAGLRGGRRSAVVVVVVVVDLLYGDVRL